MIKPKVGHVKHIIQKILDGRFVLILMTCVTIFCLIGVSFCCDLVGRPSRVAYHETCRPYILLPANHLVLLVHVGDPSYYSR